MRLRRFDDLEAHRPRALAVRLDDEDAEVLGLALASAPRPRAVSRDPSARAAARNGSTSSCVTSPAMKSTSSGVALRIEIFTRAAAVGAAAVPEPTATPARISARPPTASGRTGSSSSSAP